MELIDAHCHLDFPEFDGRREQVLARAHDSGVTRLVVSSVRRTDWRRVVQTAADLTGVFYCLGLHPWFVGEHTENDLQALEMELSGTDGHCVGLGECGLDRIKGDLLAQMPWFEAQIAIAGRLKRPLIIHSVRAHDEVCHALKAQGFTGPALVHGFSGSFQQACKLIDLGCFIGVGGVITHGRAKKTRDAISRLPLDALVLETDAPDMPPQGIEKGCNSPEYLPMILDALGELRAESKEALADQILKNTCRLYGWPAPN